MTRRHRHTSRERVPQAERAEAMRARLLDATISCLADLGYGRMSTNHIVRRAHVSRGALAHHFPTKADLLNAAAQRLIEGRATDFRERFGAIAVERRTTAEALAVLWSFYDDTGGVAMLELMVAARHNRELREVLGDMPDRVAELGMAVFAEFFPDLAALPFIDEALRSIHALYTGLALNALADGDPRGRGAEVRAFLKILIARVLATAPAPELAEA
ncbi:TetR/AcrR family transcriptional regulator [Actinokineospora iranica]|uniref:DNA-binding transcriptional regulator YbjK n=1 Tax=Actinokineospora iranica TaxID=1271860 RepID=A0A1G6IU33_9PSEU|nr:TetR/AcrR family transcriptional regulator [Actinokineospora iranica]SDC10009.1 DNA-binding transcriptional regulator YbjK [Actinokineospora iranica]